MAIIRNDRRAREAAERQAGERHQSEEDEDVDYGWHPTQEELPDPIPTERWLAMLDDPTVFDEDGMRAVRCVNDYGGPVTFQQLSVKYRGTMGRYRRWLTGVAERAAKHEGREPLGTDQLGQEEWWPYLWRQRIAGKAMANVHEMLLQPELVEALRQHDAAGEAERKAQEQEEALAEAKRRSEQRRAMLEAAAKAQAEREARQQAQEAEQPAVPAERPAARRDGWAEPASEAPRDDRPAAQQAPAPAQAAKPHKLVLDPPVEGTSEPALASLTAYLKTMEGIAAERGERDEQAGTKARKGRQQAKAGSQPAAAAPLDYAARYAARLREALELVSAGLPGLTAAQVARALGDESVEALQGVLNGTAIPSFAYVDRLCDLLFLNAARLEAADAQTEGLPVFCTLRERYGAEGAAAALEDSAPEQAVFVMDDGPERRSGTILRLGELRYALVEREPVSADADRYHDPALSAYVKFVRDVDARAKSSGLETRSLKISAADWDALASGRLWPGTLCLA